MRRFAFEQIDSTTKEDLFSCLLTTYMSLTFGVVFLASSGLSVLGVYRGISTYLSFQQFNILTQELYFISTLEKSVVAYFCLFLIPSRTGK